MRTLAIGDIHGYATTFDALLAVVDPRPADVIVALGDYVDRGPDSRGVLDRLIALESTGRLVALYGNHDEMMVEGVASDGPHRRMWLHYGGEETLASYGPRPGVLFDGIPGGHLAFLRGCRRWHETEANVYAHATINPLLPMSEQTDDALRWMKLDGSIQHYSGKTLICGHTRQLSGRPWVLPGVVCIDTAVYEGEGWLTCLHVETGEYWQANVRGETRTGRLDG